MTPGLHPNIDEATYHAVNLPSYSRLKTLITASPAHLRESIDNLEESTEAQKLGSVLDCLTLTPGNFVKRFAVSGTCKAIQKNGDPCGNPGKMLSRGEWYCGKHPRNPDNDPRQIIPQDMLDTACRMRDAVMKHPEARRLLTLPGSVQMSFVWEDEESGLRCKGRTDKLIPSASIIVDLKKTGAGKASPENWPAEILRWGYHLQGAMYPRGLAALGESYEHFVHIVVEDEPPHAVGVYRLKDEILELGWRQLELALHTYAECERSGVWPAYSEHMKDIGLPRWGEKRIEESLQEIA
jgi:hypothetical protein